MIRIAAIQWDKNKDLLRERLATETGLGYCSYLDLVKLTFDVIFNTNTAFANVYGFYKEKWLNIDRITEIDDGDYQGTFLFVIPFDTYQPSNYEYLMTSVCYGSCSGCDVLQNIQMNVEGLLTVPQIADFMSLCKDLVCNAIKPYNYGWCHNPDFDHTEGLSIDSK